MSSSPLSSSHRPRGVLLVNLGTPDGQPIAGPTADQVRVYLRQFLMDPYVIDIPFPLRWILVHWLILPKRSKQSAEAYRKIWTEKGSPLLFHHLNLTQGVARTLGKEWKVEAGMRYGSPSIPDGLAKLRAQGIDEVLVVPLYPQYSLAATESSIEECRTWTRKNAPGMKLSFYPPFFRAKDFIEAFASVARESLQGYEFDHLLFSFHGLPERHVRKTDPSGAHCLNASTCCEELVSNNQNCYRAHCFSTARALAHELKLSPDRYTVCFQSRLGRTPWVRPYTDHMYRDLAARGVKRVAVMCPAFVADCLETLEEIRIRGRDEFIRLGGEDLRLIPSLNDSEVWIKALSAMIQNVGPTFLSSAASILNEARV